MNSYEVKFKVGKRRVSQIVVASSFREAVFSVGVQMGRVFPGMSLKLLGASRLSGVTGQAVRS